MDIIGHSTPYPIGDSYMRPGSGSNMAMTYYTWLASLAYTRCVRD